MEVDFIQDFIIRQIEGQKPAEIRIMRYTGGGVEIAPGEIVPAVVPPRLLDHEVEVTVDDYSGPMFVKGSLHDGDMVVVGRVKGEFKYIVLEKINA